METDLIPIDGYPSYTIDREGNIYNVDTDKVMARSYTQQGAPKISLMDAEGNRKTLSVKRLVADNFLSKHELVHYDTAICLDGDQDNCSVDNLMWRPRFFANLYSRQFAQDYLYYHQDRVVDTDTGIVYDSIYNAAITCGVLLKDVLTSVHNGQPVRCTGQRFRFE